MFGRWFNAELRAAERAAAEGRLDDAFERLITLKENSTDAQALRGQVARGLIARARVGHRGGRHADALRDIAAAERLVALDSDALELRQQAQRGIDQKHEGADAVDRAKQRLRDGRLESAREAACRLDDTHQRRELLNQIEGAQRKLAQAMETAQAALAAGDIALAARVWSDAHLLNPGAALDDLGRQIADALERGVSEHYERGALDRAIRDAELAAPLRLHAPRLADTQALAAELRAAGAMLASGAYAELREALLRLRGRRDAPWLSGCLDALSHIVQGRDGLLASPLGRLASASVEALRSTSEAAPPSPLSVNAERPVPATVLMVDGAASALLLDKPVVRIGRAGSGHALDVAIPGDLASRHADIERDGDDYFLIAHGPTTVNRQAVRRVLLRDGDRIQFGARVKMRFARPTVRSQSAVLRLASGLRLANDVSVIALFRDTLLIGPQTSCHIPTRDTKSRVTVFARDGRLWARLADERGRPAGTARPLEDRGPTDFDDLRIAMTTMPQSIG